MLTPDDYVLRFEVDGEEDCVIGIVPDNIDTGYTIGQVFLKAYYTLFDRDSNRIGFVKSKNDTQTIDATTTVNVDSQLEALKAMRFK